jgi:hypothetical protein
VGEIALEEATDLSQDRLLNELMEHYVENLPFPFTPPLTSLVCIRMRRLIFVCNYLTLHLLIK